MEESTLKKIQFPRTEVTHEEADSNGPQKAEEDKL